MSFIGKRILILGGNGYLGNYLAARFVQQKATVMVLSRSGPRHKHPENEQITWLRGSVMEPHMLKTQINSADVLVHTIGTLFDTSVTKNAQPGDQGTYEQMNRDTLASVLSVLEKPKRIIYISSAAHPPFLSRYLTTKYEAEQMLLNTTHDGYSLRPGFIYSWKHRKWSIPIKWSIDVWNKIYPLLDRLIPRQTKIHYILEQFKQGENTDLDNLGSAVLELGLNGSSNKINEVSHVNELSLKFQNQQK